MKSARKAFYFALAFGAAAMPLFAQDAAKAPCTARPPAASAARPATYGTSAESKLRVPASAFFPWDPANQVYTSDNYGAGPRWISSGGLHDVVAPLYLPAGARIVSLELDYYDASASDALLGSLIVCDYHGRNCTYYPSAGDGPSDCIYAGFICSGVANAPGDGYYFGTAIAGDNLTIDNLNNGYTLLAETSGANDGSTKVAGIVVGYVLQVSPDPGYATFADVPVGHPQHRFVEALYASGITAGCGGGNFCPDNPLTRGQMAVFLSVALGLQWP